MKAQRPNVVASGRHLPNHRNMSATDDQFLHYQIFGAAGYGAGASRRLALARRAEAVMSASDNNPEDDRVVSFPGTEEQARAEEQAHVEEQARRFHAEVVRMAMLPESYWLFLISSDHVKKFGATKEQFEQAIRAVVAENEKKARETKADDRYVRRRNEQEEHRKEREDKRKCRDEERTRKEEERARKEAERIEREQAAKRVKREAAFAEIVGLPKLTHEVRLKEAAARLGEDFAILAEEFEVFLAARTIPEDLEPWPEPVDTAELLSAIEAKFCRYVVATDALVTASTLFGAFTYVVEVATHAPKLIYTFPERDAGKSLAQDVLRWVVLRPYAAVEATGAAIYRIIDRLRPTLLLDEADTLFARRNVLAHIINASWSNSGRKVPRAGSKGKLIEEFDVYGAQLISMRGLNIPDTTLSRCIVCMIWPKLASERVEEFAYQDDDEFKVIRRKLLRWAVDNAVALRAAKPEFPPGFNNRIRVNWKMLLAIAALAGDEWLKRALHAALELEIDRDEPSEGIRLFPGATGCLGQCGAVALGAPVRGAGAASVGRIRRLSQQGADHAAPAGRSAPAVRNPAYSRSAQSPGRVSARAVRKRMGTAAAKTDERLAPPLPRSGQSQAASPQAVGSEGASFMAIFSATGIKLDPLWGSKRMAVLDGRQVRCLTFDEGSVWIHGLDELPVLVRRRLADARQNICPTCLRGEVHKNGAPTLKLYFAVIEAIERMLDQAERRFNDDSI